MPYNPKSRSLEHKKGFRVKVGKGHPRIGEGSDGEMTLRTTNSGLKLFAKYRNRWFAVGEQSLKLLGGADGDVSLTPHNMASGTTINSRTGDINVGGAVVLGAVNTGAGQIGELATKFYATGSGDATLSCGKDLTISAGDLTISAGGDATLSCGKDLTISAAGNIIANVTGGQFTIKDTTTSDPDLVIESTHAGVAGGSLIFNHVDTSPTASSVLGMVYFNGYNDAGTQEALTYASITGLTSDVRDGTEAGKMVFSICTKDAGGTGSGVETALLLEGSDTNDEVDVTIGAGAASVTTVSGELDIDGAKITSAGVLELDPGGQLSVTGQDMSVDTTKKIFLDGGGDTYIHEQNTDILQIVVGDNILMHIQADASDADGNYISLGGATGFVRREATFSVTGAFAFGDLGGTDDTDIDFRFTNKYRLEIINDITNMNLIFPAVSGNFLLVCYISGAGGGDHDVTNWKVYKSNEVAASTTDVMWAGGSVPAFTAGTSVDIVSFYWDVTEQQCYGTASLAFATP